MTPVKYVGKKPVKTDTNRSFGTGIVWHSPGDVQLVDDVVALQMVTKYPDIWAAASDEEAADLVVHPENEVATAGVEEEPEGDPDADPDDFIEQFSALHWQQAKKYVLEVDIEELQDLRVIEKANANRKAVIDAIDLRLQ